SARCKLEMERLAKADDSFGERQLIQFIAVLLPPLELGHMCPSVFAVADVDRRPHVLVEPCLDAAEWADQDQVLEVQLWQRFHAGCRSGLARGDVRTAAIDHLRQRAPDQPPELLDAPAGL